MWKAILIWHFVSGFLAFCYQHIGHSIARWVFKDREMIEYVDSIEDPYPMWAMFLISLIMGYIALAAIIWHAVLKLFWNLLFTKKKWWK